MKTPLRPRPRDREPEDQTETRRPQRKSNRRSHQSIPGCLQANCR